MAARGMEPLAVLADVPYTPCARLPLAPTRTAFFIDFAAVSDRYREAHPDADVPFRSRAATSRAVRDAHCGKDDEEEDDAIEDSGSESAGSGSVRDVAVVVEPRGQSKTLLKNVVQKYELHTAALTLHGPDASSEEAVEDEDDDEDDAGERCDKDGVPKKVKKRAKAHEFEYDLRDPFVDDELIYDELDVATGARQLGDQHGGAADMEAGGVGASGFRALNDAQLKLGTEYAIATAEDDVPSEADSADEQCAHAEAALATRLQSALEIIARARARRADSPGGAGGHSGSTRRTRQRTHPSSSSPLYGNLSRGAGMGVPPVRGLPFPFAQALMRLAVAGMEDMSGGGYGQRHGRRKRRWGSRSPADSTCSSDGEGEGEGQRRRRRGRSRGGHGKGHTAQGSSGGMVTAGKRDKLNAKASKAAKLEAGGVQAGAGAAAEALSAALHLPRGSVALMLSLCGGGGSEDDTAATRMALNRLIADKLECEGGGGPEGAKAKKKLGRPVGGGREGGGGAASAASALFKAAKAGAGAGRDEEEEEGGGGGVDEARFPLLKSAAELARDRSRREEEEGRKKEYIRENKDKKWEGRPPGFEAAMVRYERAVIRRNERLDKASRAIAERKRMRAAQPQGVGEGAGGEAVSAGPPPPPPNASAPRAPLFEPVEGEEDIYVLMEVSEGEGEEGGQATSPSAPLPRKTLAVAPWSIPPDARVGRRFVPESGEYPFEMDGALGDIDLMVRREKGKNARPGPYLARVMAIPGMPPTKDTLIKVLVRAAAQSEARDRKAALRAALWSVRGAVERRLGGVPGMAAAALKKVSRPVWGAGSLSQKEGGGEEGEGGGVGSPRPPSDPRGLKTLLSRGWFSWDDGCRAAVGGAMRAHAEWVRAECAWREAVGKVTARRMGLAEEWEGWSGAGKLEEHREKWAVHAVLACWPMEREGGAGQDTLPPTSLPLTSWPWPPATLPEPEHPLALTPLAPLPVLTHEGIPVLTVAALTAVVKAEEEEGRRRAAAASAFPSVFPLAPSMPLHLSGPTSSASGQLTLSFIHAGGGEAVATASPPPASHPGPSLSFTAANASDAFDPLPAPMAEWRRESFHAQGEGEGAKGGGSAKKGKGGGRTVGGGGGLPPVTLRLVRPTPHSGKKGEGEGTAAGSICEVE